MNNRKAYDCDRCGTAVILAPEAVFPEDRLCFACRAINNAAEEDRPRLRRIFNREK